MVEGGEFDFPRVLPYPSSVPETNVIGGDGYENIYDDASTCRMAASTNTPAYAIK
jgi:hypothetical protein